MLGDDEELKQIGMEWKESSASFARRSGLNSIAAPLYRGASAARWFVGGRAFRGSVGPSFRSTCLRVTLVRARVDWQAGFRRDGSFDSLWFCPRLYGVWDGRCGWDSRAIGASRSSGIEWV